MTKILIVVSGADAVTLTDGTKHRTGFWAEELVVPHRLFREAAVEVDIATPGGRVPTVDPLSLDARGGVQETAVKEYRDYLELISGELKTPLGIADVSAADYDGIFIPGGHGPMADLAHDPDLGRLLAEADRRGRIIAPLCHGPAGLLSATRADGGFAFAGRRLAAFTDAEERQGGLAKKAPWLLETTLRARGAEIDAAAPWTSNVVVDGNLISGQNPQSSADLARHVLAALRIEAAA